MPTIRRMSWRRSNSLHCAGVSGAGGGDTDSSSRGDCNDDDTSAGESISRGLSVACACSTPRSPSEASTPAYLPGGRDTRTRAHALKIETNEWNIQRKEAVASGWDAECVLTQSRSDLAPQRSDFCWNERMKNTGRWDRGDAVTQ